MKSKILKVYDVLDLIRWTRPYGTLLLAAPALWSLVIASQGHPPFHLVIIFCLGAFLMRSAGCTINDIVDQNVDIHVDRTKGRPLPSGRLSTFQALMVFAGLSLSALALIWWLNPFTRLLSVIAMFLAVLYPFSKRYFRLPQMVMALVFGWGTIMAWAAVRNTIEFPVLFIFLATFSWATAYDTIYAMMDAREDHQIGVKSTALLFGDHAWWIVGFLFGTSLLSLVYLGLLTELGPVYYLTLLLVTAWFFRQVLLLRKHLGREKLFSLFKSHATIGFVLLLGILLGYHLP